MRLNYKTLFVFLSLSLSSFSLYAVETAPRISDREIIIALAELKAGQQHTEQRFDQIDRRFDQMQKTMDGRFDQMQRTLEANSAQMNKRLAFIESLMVVMITAILGLVGFIIWDRKTALRPLEKKLDKLEQDLQHDLELQNPAGSRLTRVIRAFQDLAEHDPKVAQILQSFSLL